MPLRRPVITGTGIVSAAGCGVGQVWDSLRSGRAGLGPLTLFPSTRYARQLVGQVCEDVDRLAGPVRGSRSDKLIWIAAKQALVAAGFADGHPSLAPERLGVAIGSTVGGMLGTERWLAGVLREQRHRFGPLRFHSCASSANLCARQMGAAGPCLTVSNACAAGAMALAMAARMIENGEADLVLAGGGDSLARLTLNGFGSLLLLDPEGCRPFDARRTGISLGEGAGMLVVEDEACARARGATILATLAGWGASCDAFHATAPHPEGQGALAAMRAALHSAGLPPTEVDFVSAHGTGTPDNDLTEARALRALFGDRLPDVASWMRFFGHSLAASGALKAVVCVEALRQQAAPPSLGCEQADPALEFIPLREFTARPLRHILSNSFGFGGNNVALVFSQATVPAPAQTPVVELRSPPPWLAILSASVASAAGETLVQVGQALAQGGAVPRLFEVPLASPPGRLPAYVAAEHSGERLIDSAKRRKLSRLQRLVLATARQSLPADLLQAADRARVCVAMGTGLGSLNDTAAFVENLILQDERAPRPLFFSNSVHNSLAAQVAIDLGLKGPNFTAVQDEISFEAALWQAVGELRGGQADLALVGAADELNAHHLAAGMRWGWWHENAPPIHPFASALQPRERALPGEGCALFVVASEPAATNPMAWLSALRVARVQGRVVDPVAEAGWIAATLTECGVPLSEVDVVLTSANGETAGDRACQAVGAVFSQLAGRPVPVGAYQHGCGAHMSASAFGFAVAVGLVQGEIPISACAAPGAATPMGRCRTVVLYNLSPGGGKALCCVCA